MEQTSRTLSLLKKAARHNHNLDQVPSLSYPRRAVRLSCAAWASVCAIQRSLAPAGACTVSTTPSSACTASASPLQTKSTKKKQITKKKAARHEQIPKQLMYALQKLTRLRMSLHAAVVGVEFQHLRLPGQFQSILNNVSHHALWSSDEVFVSEYQIEMKQRTQIKTISDKLIQSINVSDHSKRKIT